MDICGITKVSGTPPDGLYEAQWQGYEVTFNAMGKEFKGATDAGVRGLFVCKVRVKNGKCKIED